MSDVMFNLPQTDRRTDAVITTAACASKNGNNHFHRTRFCCRVCCGGDSDLPLARNDKFTSTELIGGRAERVHLVKIEMCKPRKGGRGQGKRTRPHVALCAHPVLLSVFNRPPLHSLIRTGLLWPYCSIPYFSTHSSRFPTKTDQFIYLLK